VPIYIARRFVKYSLIDSVLKPGLSAVVMGFVMLLVRQILPINLIAVGVLAAVGAVSYGVSSYLIYGPSIVGDVKKIIKNISKK
jgi:hypothetical protein